MAYFLLVRIDGDHYYVLRKNGEELAALADEESFDIIKNIISPNSKMELIYPLKREDDEAAGYLQGINNYRYLSEFAEGCNPNHIAIAKDEIMNKLQEL
jgi:hypothetical protein